MFCTHGDYCLLASHQCHYFTLVKRLQPAGLNASPSGCLKRVSKAYKKCSQMGESPLNVHKWWNLLQIFTNRGIPSKVFTNGEILSKVFTIGEISSRIYWFHIIFSCTGRERLIRSTSSARFSFELSGNSN